MKDMTKASNPIYLAFFLLVVCGVSTLVMAFTAVKTGPTIKEAEVKETEENLKLILPGFDKTVKSEIKSPAGNTVVLYTATKNGQVVGYAAEAKGKGFGGDVTGLVSFETDGTIRTVIVKSGHAETPGIGTKVTDRTAKRTISDVVKGVKPDTSKLIPNAALDAYAGQKPGDAKWTKETAPKNSFVTGATYSSTAVCDLVWDAATAVRDHIAAQGLPTASAAQSGAGAAIAAGQEAASAAQSETVAKLPSGQEAAISAPAEQELEFDPAAMPAAVPAAEQTPDGK